MASGALTVQDDGTLTVVPRPDEDTAAFEATLARFTELFCPTPGQRVYRLTAASLRRARRAGLTLEEALQTLETASTTALPTPGPGRSGALESSDRPPDRGGRPGLPPAADDPSAGPHCGAAASHARALHHPPTRCHHGRAAARHLSSIGADLRCLWLSCLGPRAHGFLGHLYCQQRRCCL